MMRKTFVPPHSLFARSIRLARWALATVILIGLASTAWAETIDIPLTSTTYIDQGNTTSNYGAKTQLKDVVNGPAHYSGTVTRGLLALPSITVPAGEEIESVSLDLYCSYYSPPTGGSIAFSAMVYPLTHGFVQGTGGGVSTSGATWLTYNGTNDWTAPGGDFDSSVSVVASATPVLDTWTSFNLTNIWTNPSLAAQKQEFQNYGALLTVSPENPNLISPSSWVTEEFASDVWVNSPGTNYNPYLAVTFAPVPVPEPSTLALLMAGMGLAAIAVGRRYRAGRSRLAPAGPAA